MKILNVRLKKLSLLANCICSGDTSLLDSPTGVILLSRRSRRPDPREWWIRAALQAAGILAEESRVVVCGGGILHLDFVRWAASRNSDVVYIDVKGAGRNRRTQKDETPDWCTLRIEPDLSDLSDKKEKMRLRDSVMIDLSDRIIAVAVRKGGNMEALCRAALDAGKRVEIFEPPGKAGKTLANSSLIVSGAIPIYLNESDCRALSKSKRMRQMKLPISMNPYRSPGPDLDDYLWHFTRECAGPWPDQSWDAYFNELADGEPEAQHDAIDSLEHILRGKIIKACGAIVRGGHEVVCWTSMNPLDAATKTLWRPALGRWNFKPYAIGVKKTKLLKYGARPVVYGDEQDYSNMPENKRYLFQKARTETADWRPELEWRTSGDFGLNTLKPEEALALVKNIDEKPRIEAACDYRVVAIEEYE